MATKFGDKDFNSSAYRDYRPTYDQSLYKLIYDFHTRHEPEARFDTCVDLATGTGQAALDLAPKFKHVYAFDNSATMLKSAVANPKITYAEGSDTTIPVADHSADVLTVAQAAHWFDWDGFCKEASRVLKPNGTVAVWGYSLLVVDKNKVLTDMVNDYNDNVMKKYWDTRRFILDAHYADLKLEPYFAVTERIVLPTESMPSPISKTVTVETFFAYMRTWSAWKNYREQHPDHDPLIDLQAKVMKALGDTSTKDTLLDIYWPTILLLGKHAKMSHINHDRNILALQTSVDSSALFDIAVDMATGTGQAALDLTSKFNQILAFDLSASMLKAAIPHPKIKYAEGRDSNIPAPSNSVDVITVAEAAHWFDWQLFIREALRILKPNGTLAVFGYFMLVVKDQEKITRLVNDFNEIFLDEYFDKRRHLLDDWYARLPLEPYFQFSDRIMLGTETIPSPVTKTMTVSALLEYCRTWSGYKTYRELHKDQPDELECIKQKILTELGPNAMDQIVDVYWPTVLLLAKSKIPQ
ncbi:hypothetical protein SmJEL517_g00251 [Synchytrium microbalum]|uniref:Methyltransferase type 11 domain-containing protein n=1 Tax=Synchytrium microbalum TaxID=1806994 RepID=A0A507CJN6_9FUNG|nr:uncharacterized protein SmJEL517_g00251 [Synchytrium microbalum]TPX37973.1 hypothetical protein SmJEL517_g00251 [Synchytrium microbalum]